VLHLPNKSGIKVMPHVRVARPALRQTYNPDSDCAYFIPLSAGIGAKRWKAGGPKLLERYNETGSIRPEDNSNLPRNASYYIGLLLAAKTGNRRKRPVIGQ
jgi:hypothetical protein